MDDFRSGERVCWSHRHRRSGIDVAEIATWSTSICPPVPEDYVHRIGRTARAAASGRATSFASPEEHELLRGIEKLTRRSVARAAVPRESAAFRPRCCGRPTPASGSSSKQRAERAGTA